MGAKLSLPASKFEQRKRTVDEHMVDSRTLSKVRTWLENARFSETTWTGQTLEAITDSTASKSFVKVQSEGSTSSCYFEPGLAEEEDTASCGSQEALISAQPTPFETPASPEAGVEDKESVNLVERLPASKCDKALDAVQQPSECVPASTQPEQLQRTATSAASRRCEPGPGKQMLSRKSSKSLYANENAGQHFRGDSCFDADKSSKKQSGHVRKMSQEASSFSASPRKVARPLHRCCSQPSITAASILASPEFARKTHRTFGQSLRKNVKAGFAAVGSCLKVMCLAPNANKIQEINSLDACITRADVLEAERLTNGNRKLKRRLLKQLRKARVAASAAQQHSMGVRNAF